VIRREREKERGERERVTKIKERRIKNNVIRRE